MSYTVTKFPQGTFSWTDVSSTNFEATKKFMTGLMNWKAEDMPAGNGMTYTMFYVDGKTVAGGSQMPESMKGVPSFWSSYISVDNVDATAKKAEKLGGKIIMPAMDVLDSGRMAGIQDPTSATFMIWQPQKHIGAGIVNTIGAMSWNELYTKDLEAAKKFYAGLFGWTYETDERGYVTIKNNGRMNGGMMAIAPEMAGMPPNWTVYFTVKNMAESVASVKKLGGVVHLDSKPIPIGKISMIADPSGASFMMIEMSVPPTEWEDPK